MKGSIKYNFIISFKNFMYLIFTRSSVLHKPLALKNAFFGGCITSQCLALAVVLVCMYSNINGSVAEAKINPVASKPLLTP